MGEPLVEPQHLGGAGAPQVVLPEADHVLELVDERHRDEAVHLGDGVRAAQGPRRVRHERVEDLHVVALTKDQVRAVEIPGHESGRATLERADELVHRVRHHHDHHSVPVDVRLAAERQRVPHVQQRVELVTQ